VNEAFSMRYWPGQDPIGKRMRLNGSQGPWVEIVGLTRTGKYGFIGEPPTPVLYEPFAQNVRTQMSLVVETTSPDAASLAGPLREVVRAVDVNQPVFNVRTVSSLFEQRALGPPLMVARVATAIGVLGLSLALIGLYGLVAYSVARRTREIGLRIAMGAERSLVVSMVLRQGLTLSIAGIVVGGVLSLAVARLLMSAMSGLAAPSLAVSMLVPFMLIGLTLLASYVPARRAASVDPLRALRDE
jgi:putative ABC transport system permease protein